MSDQYSVYLTTLSSMISGAISRLIVHPVDTIKAKLQVSQGKNSNDVINIRSVVRNTLKNEGIKGLYRGLMISWAGSAPGVCVYFSAYEFSKQTLLEYEIIRNNNFLAHFSSGMFAEFVSCAIFVPIDVIKERLQVQSNLNIYNYKGGADAFKIIMRTEGIRGIYKAYGATVASFGPFSALYFALYEKFKFMTVGEQKEIGFWPSLLCAGIAGSIASVVTNPLDMAKVRMQVVRASASSGAQIFQYKNMFHGIYLIWKHEGFKALFQGSFARCLFHTPNTAIIMGTVETIRAHLEKIYDSK